jgi:hypothetical protein
MKALGILGIWLVCFGAGFGYGKYRSPSLGGMMARDSEHVPNFRSVGVSSRFESTYRMACGDVGIHYEVGALGRDTIYTVPNLEYKERVSLVHAGVAIGLFTTFVDKWVFDLSKLSKELFAPLLGYSPKDWRVLTVVGVGSVFGVGLGYVSGYSDPVDCNDEKARGKLLDKAVWRVFAASRPDFSVHVPLP